MYSTDIIITKVVLEKKEIENSEIEFEVKPFVP